MNILVNLLQCREKYTGTGRYIYNILKYLTLIDNNKYICIVSKNNANTYFIYNQNIRQIIVPINNDYKLLRILYEQIILPFKIAHFNKSNTILWSPNDVSILLWFGKQIVTIHDLRRLFYPEYFNIFEQYYYKTMMYISAKRGYRIFTVSNYSKMNINKYYNIDNKKIIVTYNSSELVSKYPNNSHNFKKIKCKYGIRFPYFIFVGQQLKIKSPDILVKAFIEFNKKRPYSSLVLIGKKGNATSEILFYKSILKDNIHIIDWIQDDELVLLYKHAQALIFPSISEGFGIPIIEAMQLGTPVVTTRYSSIPEIAGDAAYYLSDVNEVEIVKAMNSLYLQENCRKEYIKLGLIQSKKFNWRNTSQIIKKCFNSV
jgi:glycosyltransferase involved in cell wall biosynthesis